VIRDPEHAGKRHVWEPGDPAPVCGVGSADRGTKPEGHEVPMNGRGKSDSLGVPEKLSNKTVDRVAERVEGRGLAEGNPREDGVFRTQGRGDTNTGLERVREAAERDRRQKFTALLHHVHDVKQLQAAYRGLNPKAVAGVDGETWKRYGEDLAENLRDLSERLKRGAYRASPVKRAYIAKADGRRRPLGVPVLEDKIVQRSVVEVLNAIYETEFVGFSYGFRPGRRAHEALDALATGIVTRKVNWVLDADIRSFFDTLDRRWLVEFLEHRVSDRRVIRLVKKWLAAGVLEEGEWKATEAGTVQGGSISPLLANVYLHYVFDTWVKRWRKTQAKGDVIVVRFADDFVVGFEHRAEAEQFLVELKERLLKFGLELHSEKTRLIEFGRLAAEEREKRGEGRPETFDFLGFTHLCGKTRGGRFAVVRQTITKRLKAKLKAVSTVLRRRLHDSVPALGAYLRAVMLGHMQYYAVPFNIRAIQRFRYGLVRLWRQTLSRRSQRAHVTWERIAALERRWIPPAHICHMYPDQRVRVMTQGRSRMR
jgi:RNA-directed DNA polymerase